ncbi:MAG: hypothetical protein ACK4TT_02815 [Phenylobacterium sp.]
MAGTAGWMARRAMQKNPEIEQNLRSTLKSMFPSSFTDGEITTLQDRALDAAEWKDLLVLQGIEAGSTVTLTPAQKARVDRLVNKLGDDALGRRARGAYGDALSRGQIRVE